MNENLNYNQSGNSKKILIIVCIIAIICVLVFVYFKFIKADNKSENNNNPNNTITKSVEENTLNNINNSANSDNKTVSSNTNTAYDENGTFLMAIADVYTETNKGTVITGKIERGTINVNDTVQIIGLDNETKTTVVTRISKNGKTILDTAKVGDDIGLLLKDIDRTEVSRGQVAVKPNSIKNVKKFDARVYVLKQAEGGSNNPFKNGYKPQIFCRVTDVTGVIKLQSSTKMVNPGETADMTIELVTPMAMEVGTKFNIRDGGRMVGTGTVTEIY